VFPIFHEPTGDRNAYPRLYFFKSISQINLRRLDLIDLSGSLVLPVASGLERPVERDSSGTGTIVNTTAAIPALIRVQDHGGLTLLGIRDIDIDLADFDTMIAAVAAIGIESDRLVGRDYIRHGDYFILSHIILH
jgi:hypothetical protein